MKLPLAALFVVFALIATTLRIHGEISLDQAIFGWLAPLRSEALTRVFRALTFLGNGASLAVTATVAAGAFWFLRLPRSALFIAACAAGSGAVNQLLKLGFERPRPDVSLHLASTAGFSFPSGHSMVGATLYVVLAIVISARIPRLKRVIWAIAALLVVGIGLSRVYLHVHYPSDVLAGWALGLSLPIWLHTVLVRSPSVATPEPATPES